MSYFKTLKLRPPQLSKQKQQQQQPSHASSEFDDEDEEEDKEEEQCKDEDDNETVLSAGEEGQNLSQVVLDSSGASFEGMRLKESINPMQTDSFFKVQRKTDAADVYIHKQTARWVLTNDQSSRSSNHLEHVTQTKGDTVV